MRISILETLLHVILKRRAEISADIFARLLRYFFLSCKNLTIIARTDIIDVKVQGQEIEHETLKREVESLKRLNEKLSNDVRNAGKQMDELE